MLYWSVGHSHRWKSPGQAKLSKNVMDVINLWYFVIGNWHEVKG